jgi:hypothetical protein
LSAAELQFLESDLAQNEARHPKFVFFHKPFWIPLVRVGSGEFALHKLAKKYGVDYIVSGHGHTFMRLPFDGVVYMEVGSSGGGVEKKMIGGTASTMVFLPPRMGLREGGKVSMIVRSSTARRSRAYVPAEDWVSVVPFDTRTPPTRQTQ